MNNIKVVQFSNLNDEVSKLSEEINSKYCELNNYDYEFEHFEYDSKNYNDIIEFANKKENLAALMAHKYEIVLKNLNQYDYVVFVDGDACFNNPNRKIEEFIDDHCDFFLSRDSGIVGPTIFSLKIANIIQQVLTSNKLSYIPNFKDFSEIIEKQTGFDFLSKMGTIVANPLGLNTGFMIFKNSKIIEEFLKDCRKYHPLFHNMIYDQDCISFLLQMKKYKNMYKILDTYLQGNTELKSQPEYCYNEDKNFICHNYGQPFETKVIAMTNVKNNKWWKNVFKENISMSFLILQTETALGDTLVTTNFFKDFKEQYPNYEIYYKVDSNNSYAIDQKIDVFKNNPNVTIWNGEHIDKIVKYNCGDFLEGSKQHDNIMNHSIYEIFKKETGIEVKQNTFNSDIYLSDKEKTNFVLRKFNIPTDKPICLICAGYHPIINTVKYAGTKKFQNIVDALYDRITFVQVGDTGNGYKQNLLNHVINLIDKTNIRDLFMLSYHARYIVTGLHALLHIGSIITKEKRDVYVFQGCRENISWYASYFNLENIKYHVYGYHPENYKQCLGNDKCCIKDITSYNQFNKNLKICNNVMAIDNEVITKCLNDIDENEIIENISEKLK